MGGRVADKKWKFEEIQVSSSFEMQKRMSYQAVAKLIQRWFSLMMLHFSLLVQLCTKLLPIFLKSQLAQRVKNFRQHSTKAFKMTISNQQNLNFRVSVLVL